MYYGYILELKDGTKVRMTDKTYKNLQINNYKLSIGGKQIDLNNYLKDTKIIYKGKITNKNDTISLLEYLKLKGLIFDRVKRNRNIILFEDENGVKFYTTKYTNTGKQILQWLENKIDKVYYHNVDITPILQKSNFIGVFWLDKTPNNIIPLNSYVRKIKVLNRKNEKKKKRITKYTKLLFYDKKLNIVVKIQKYTYDKLITNNYQILFGKKLVDLHNIFTNRLQKIENVPNDKKIVNFKEYLKIIGIFKKYSAIYIILKTNDSKLLHVSRHTKLGENILDYFNGNSERIYYSKWKYDVTDYISEMKFIGLACKVPKESTPLRTYLSCNMELRPKCIEHVFYGLLFKGNLSNNYYALYVTWRNIKRYGKKIDFTNAHEILRIDKEILDKLFTPIEIISFSKAKKYVSIHDSFEFDILTKRILYDKINNVYVRVSKDIMYNFIKEKNIVFRIHILTETFKKRFELPKILPKQNQILTLTKYLKKFGIELEDIVELINQLPNNYYLIVQHKSTKQKYKIFCNSYVRLQKIIEKYSNEYEIINIYRVNGRIKYPTIHISI